MWFDSISTVSFTDLYQTDSLSAVLDVIDQATNVRVARDSNFESDVDRRARSGLF